MGIYSYVIYLNRINSLVYTCSSARRAGVHQRVKSLRPSYMGLCPQKMTNEAGRTLRRRKRRKRKAAPCGIPRRSFSGDTTPNCCRAIAEQIRLSRPAFGPG